MVNRNNRVERAGKNPSLMFESIIVRSYMIYVAEPV